MIKVMSVVGTRPEAIKMAPVIQELNRYPEAFDSIVCATAQHREMLDQVLGIFDISIDDDLNVMQPNQTLTQVTARILTSFDGVVRERKPDWVLVQGDTTTAMVASLAAYYHHIQVGHVEAGLRTDDKYQPFPEEVNRRIVDVLADLYFVPTEGSCENLLREGIPGEKILITGNTVIDALLMTARKVQNRPLDTLVGNLAGRRLILVTAHRRENFGAPLEGICQAIREIAGHYPDTLTVYPVHPNPNVCGPVHSFLGNIPNIKLIEPVNYEDMVNLMSQSYIILTDSGGLQEEAPSLHKPLLVLREVTERPEVVALGAARLVGTDPQKIFREAARLLSDDCAYREMTSVENPYGDGRASEKIVQALLKSQSKNFGL